MIRIDTNAKQIADQLKKLATDQIPYATAVALTNVAAVGQRAAREEMRSAFTLRNKFSESGIQTVRAEKRDWPHQSSKVGIEQKRDYLIDQVLGATRKPLKSPYKGVPQLDVIKRTASGRVPARLRPKALMQAAQAKTKKRGGGFYLVNKGAKQYLFKAVRGGRSVLAYAFSKTVRIKPVFKFQQAVERAVRASYADELSKAIEQAMKSRR